MVTMSYIDILGYTFECFKGFGFYTYYCQVLPLAFTISKSETEAQKYLIYIIPVLEQLGYGYVK